MSNYSNATFAMQCDTSGNPSSSTNLGILISFKAMDKAGNVGELTSYYLILDPNGNIPVVTINQPATGLTFGGQQTITGTATQTVAIYGVEVAVDPAGGTNFPTAPISVSTISGTTLTATGHPFTSGMMVFLSGTTPPQINSTPISPTTPYWVCNPTANTFQVFSALDTGGNPVVLSFTSAGSGVTASVWAPATLQTTGSSVIWSYNINTSNAYPQQWWVGKAQQTVTVQARAWNSPTIGGSKGTISGLLTSPLVMTFDSTFPQVQNVQVSDQVNGQAITQSYYAQMTTRGTIGLTGIVSSSKGISKIESVENSPLSGSTTLYNTANSYATTVASNGSYWSSTVTPPATQSNVTFASGNPYRVMITATGSNSALWTCGRGARHCPGNRVDSE